MGLLTLPYGLALGWVTGPLAISLIQHGFYPVPATLLIAPALSLYTWRIVPAPFIDSTLSLRRWYLIGLALAIVGMLPFAWLFPAQGTERAMTLLIGVSQAGALLLLLTVSGYMVRCVTADRMGRAAGWYQAGILGGQALTLIGSHALSDSTAGKITFGLQVLGMLIGMVVCYRLPALRPAEQRTIPTTAKQALSDGRSWFRSSNGIFTTLMALSPIGIGASAIGWNIGTQLYAIPPDESRWLIGPLTIMASLAGFLVGGWAADRYGRWKTWLRAGSLLAAMALFIAFCPFIHWLFEAGIGCYVFLTGCCTAAFWAIVTQAVRPRLAITKITLLSMAMGTAAFYMRVFCGWVCDDFSFQSMLVAEALLSLICIGIAVLLKRRWRVHG